MTVPATPISDHPSNGSPTWLLTREDIALILEATTDIIVVTDQVGRIVFLNPIAQQLLRRTRDAVGVTFHDIFSQMMSTGEVAWIPSHSWKRGDGTQFDLSISFWPRTQRGVRVGGVIVVRDMTDALEFQRDVQRAARLAEDAPNPIVEFDATGAML